MKKYIALLILILTPLMSSAIAAGIIRVRSTSVDSVFVDNIFAGITPLRVRVPLGVHSVRCCNQTKKVLVEIEDITPCVTFIPLKWSKDATKKQREVITRIMSDMQEEPTDLIQYSALKNYFSPFDPRLRDTVRVAGKRYVIIPGLYISRFTTSVEDWETILKSAEMDDSYYNLNISRDDIKIVNDKRRVNTYLQRIKSLCGLEFTLPDSLSLVCMNLHYPTRDLESDEANKSAYTYEYLSRGYNDRLSRKICINNCAEEYTLTSDSVCFKYNRMQVTRFDKSGAFRVVLKLPDIPIDAPITDLTQQITSERQQIEQNNRTEFEQYLAKAEAGDSHSMAMLGAYYHLGIGTDRDNEKAVEWDIKAAKLGDSTGLKHLAYYSKHNISPKIPATSAAQIYEHLAGNGNMRALSELANCYFVGFGVIHSDKTAKEIAQKAADKGSHYGEYMLARCLQSETENNENTNDILKLYLKSISCTNPEDINPDSYYRIGQIMEDMKEYETATIYFRLAYSHNVPKAYLKYAENLRQGIGCAINEESAVAICYEYYNATRADFDQKADAAYQIARYYLTPAHENHSLQLKWYTIAADMGHAAAQYAAGMRYMNREHDTESGLYYFQLAAERGNQDAMMQLAKYYRSIENDEQTALYWEQQADIDSQTHTAAAKQKDQRYKQMFHWNGCEEYMDGDNLDKIIAKYGRSVESCIAVFCHTWENPYKLFSTSTLITLDSWTDVFFELADANSESYPEMCRFISETYMRVLQHKAEVARSCVDQDKVLGQDALFWWNRSFSTENDDINRCLLLAVTFCNEALAAYKKRGDTGSINYTTGLLQKADIAYYLNEPETCIEYINKSIEAIRNVLISAVKSGQPIDQQKEVLAQLGLYLSAVIPNYCNNDTKLKSQYAMASYNCALLYKGMQVNLQKKGITKAQRIQNIQINWKSIQNKLKPGEVSIEIIRTLQPITNEMYYCVAIVRPDTEPVYITLSYESKLYDFYNGNEFVYTSEFSYDVFWKRFESYIKDCHTIYYSPDGIYNWLQTESVPYDGHTYVDEHWKIYRLSSTRELLADHTESPIHSALLVGGLDYGVTKSSRIRGVMSNLPESLVEVTAIDSMMQKQVKHVSTLSDTMGNEATLRATIANQDVVHIASHGYYWNKDQIQLNKRMSFMANATPDNIPMLSSGLMVSGANQTIAARGDDIDIRNDGIITAAEIAEMDLSSAKLVVLSACQSGLSSGSIDGVNGLQRGLKLAGVQSLLLSLWEVNDKATRLFMEEFYRILLSGQSKQEALKGAKKYLRTYSNTAVDNNKVKLYPYNAPQYWNGFVLIDAVD